MSRGKLLLPRSLVQLEMLTKVQDNVYCYPCGYVQHSIDYCIQQQLRHAVLPYVVLYAIQHHVMLRSTNSNTHHGVGLTKLVWCRV